jgi:hypothetical protein
MINELSQEQQSPQDGKEVVSKSFFSREEISGPPFYLTWLFPSFLSLI